MAEQKPGNFIGTGELLQHRLIGWKTRFGLLYYRKLHPVEEHLGELFCWPHVELFPCKLKYLFFDFFDLHTEIPAHLCEVLLIHLNTGTFHLSKHNDQWYFYFPVQWEEIFLIESFLKEIHESESNIAVLAGIIHDLLQWTVEQGLILTGDEICIVYGSVIEILLC